MLAPGSVYTLPSPRLKSDCFLIKEKVLALLEPGDHYVIEREVLPKETRSVFCQYRFSRSANRLRSRFLSHAVIGRTLGGCSERCLSFATVRLKCMLADNFWTRWTGSRNALEGISLTNRDSDITLHDTYFVAVHFHYVSQYGNCRQKPPRSATFSLKHHFVSPTKSLANHSCTGEAAFREPTECPFSLLHRTAG